MFVLPVPQGNPLAFRCPEPHLGRMNTPDPVSRLNAALEGRYRIEREIGEGGMATVYLAKDLKHNRNVALKVLKPELATIIGAERFLAEIRTGANLQHPHVLPLFDSGEADGFVFYVMPYVKGDFGVTVQGPGWALFRPKADTTPNFGFTWEVVDQLRESAAYIGRVEFVEGARYAENVDGEDLVISLLAHADRIASFLPPREKP